MEVDSRSGGVGGPSAVRINTSRPAAVKRRHVLAHDSLSPVPVSLSTQSPNMPRLIFVTTEYLELRPDALLWKV